MYIKKSHIHFIGIGGIGMSGIAKILKCQGYTISGCDQDVTQETVKQLKKIGCSVYQGNNTPLCNDNTIDVLVYIPMYATSIPSICAEIRMAQKKGIPTISRALMLAELMRTKYSIAITGTHGKTTTTSLISHILIEANMDPTVVIGGQLKTLSTNARLGQGDFLVAEADESDRSFLYLHATLAVVTNIDKEHLETFKDLDDIKNSFRQFISNLPFYGKAIMCYDDENIRSLLPISHVKIITYGLSSHADIIAQNVKLNVDHSIFTVAKKNSPTFGDILLPMPGIHNVLNALGAITLSMELDIPFETIKNALSRFEGVDRRFTFHGIYRNAEIFDDYGHHPKEIEQTLIVARKRAKNKLIVVFQFHRYTRTKELWNDFITTFLSFKIDNLIITDIYSAGEYPIPHITSKLFVEDLKSKNPSFKVNYIPFDENFDSIIDEIDSSVESNDLLLFLGAGKTHLMAKKLA